MQPAPDLYVDEAMAVRPAVVRTVTSDTADTVTLHLDSPEPVFPFAPGQFNMLYAWGVGESAISISGDPGRPEELVHTIRKVGAVTSALTAARPGDVIGVRGPYGTPWPVVEAEGSDVVFVAGGIGLAPLRPAILHVLNHRKRYGRVVILYGTRSPADILYASEVRRWRGRFDTDVGVTVDVSSGDWAGMVGVVTKLIPIAPYSPPDATAFVCGPEIMMRFAAKALVERGTAPGRVHVSMERNMKCGIGLCGHCQFGPLFVCKDGPVVDYERVAGLLEIREI